MNKIVENKIVELTGWDCWKVTQSIGGYWSLDYSTGKLPYEVQLDAVRYDGCAIQWIKNPSEELQLEAVKQNADVIQYIKNPTHKVLILSELMK